MEPFDRTSDFGKKYSCRSPWTGFDGTRKLVRGDLGRPFSSSSGSLVTGLFTGRR